MALEARLALWDAICADIAAQRDRPGRAQDAEPLPDGGLRRTSRPAGTI
jgi:hypothetical protein